jgi:hypothetical protein
MRIALNDPAALVKLRSENIENAIAVVMPFQRTRTGRLHPL